uniref:DNA-directed RNA polymerase n=1 Tax=Kirchneriella aperta TaxID=117505 RepID=A0A140H9W9_9CHLO|nr:RNA polymerase beta subunit [Kirchneriella aperta]AMO00968.1 RNA polymerase beta subunit [Kirchneriella aperta]
MKKNSFFLPDFIELQRESYFSFLKKGISEEIQKRNPITNKEKNIEIFFYPEHYKLTKSVYTVKQAIYLQKSYVSKLYIPVQLTNKKHKKVFLKWALLGHLPLMTNRGHFLLNGSARIIVNQLIRSPGIYFRESFYEIYANQWSENPESILKRFYADIICVKGTWLRLEIDKDFCLWGRMKKGPKIPLLWLLLGFGLNEQSIFNQVVSPDLLLRSFEKEFEEHTKKSTFKEMKYPYVSSPVEAWQELSELLNLKKGKRNPLELGRKWLFKKFMNPRTYDLGKTGRLSLNKKLNLTLSLFQTTLTSQDLLAATNCLIKVAQGSLKTDDIDHLKNRRVRTAGDLIQNQFGLGLIRLEKNIRLKLSLAETTSSETSNIRFLINSRAVNGVFREFFGTNPLSQFMDQINPLAELTHKRRLTSLGPGGVARDTATLAVRGIHPSHYGRICPIETPEGKNTGLVNSITTYARINSQGLIETPFYKIYKGQIQKEKGIFYLSADQEDQLKLATPDLKISKLGFLPKSSLPARSGEDFVKISRFEADYIGVSPLQMISIATSFIPFLEHDDANRALMGSNMQRQAVPLMRPQRPLVGTGLEARAVSDSGHALLSMSSGYIFYVSASKIILYN